MPMAEIQDEPSSSSSSNVLLGKYEMGRLLGCGGFAKVYHARHLRTGHSVAVKAVSKHKVELCNLFSHVKREVSIMRRLRHPHIIRLFEVLATRTKIYFIMEFAKGGELFAKVAKARFSEDLSRRYFHQLISAVGYCHSRGVYHRDLKPENLLLDENWSLKISDFGLSAVKEQGMLHTLCGTPAYVAPEILAKRGYDGAKVDIWSCGIILFVLNAGYLPFNDANLMTLYRKIYRGEFRCPKWMSPELRRFLGRLLDTNPETRITVDEIIQDPWFKKGYNYNYNCTLKSKIGPGLGLGLVEQPEEDGDDDENNNKMEKGGGFITAFDLISYSPGFSLSGLFGVEQRQWQETYVSTEAVETVVGRIEEEARGIDAPKVEVERVKGGMGVSVEAQNGDFGLLIHLHRLTEDLLLVEVNKTDKDDFWKHQLRPRISHLFYQPPPS